MYGISIVSKCSFLVHTFALFTKFLGLSLSLAVYRSLCFSLKHLKEMYIFVCTLFPSRSYWWRM
jgi:hypothetical protein